MTISELLPFSINSADQSLALQDSILLTGVPAAISLVDDPLGVGVFLRASMEKPAARQQVTLGSFSGVQRFTCCYRYDPWWVTPAMGTRGRDVSAETQYLLAELTDGRYAVLLPLLALMAARTLPLDSLITMVEPLDRLPEVFQGLEKQPGAMKVLIRCGNP